MTETVTKPGKAMANIRSEDPWKTRTQRQITTGEKNCPYLLNQVQVLI
jgi:hypothetical protein